MRVGRFGFTFVFWMFMSLFMGLLVGQCMGMGVGVCVCVFVATLIKRNQVNVAVPDASQGNQCLRKSMNSRRWPAQYNGLQAMVVVKVRVQAGDDQIMVIVL